MNKQLSAPEKVTTGPMPENIPPDVADAILAFVAQHGSQWKMKLYKSWSTGNLEFYGPLNQAKILLGLRYDRNIDFIFGLPVVFETQHSLH